MIVYVDKQRRIVQLLRRRFPKLDKDEINDAYQDAWEQYCRLADSRREKIENHFAWMVRVSMRYASAICRKKQKCETVTYDVLEDNECEEHYFATNNTEVYNYLIEAINVLPEGMATIVYKHYIAGYTYKEISEMHGKTEEAVKKTAQRAIIKLRTIWQEKNEKIIH